MCDGWYRTHCPRSMLPLLARHVDLLLISLQPIAPRREGRSQLTSISTTRKKERLFVALIGQLRMYALWKLCGAKCAGRRDSLAKESAGNALLPRHMSQMPGDEKGQRDWNLVQYKIYHYGSGLISFSDCAVAQGLLPSVLIIIMMHYFSELRGGIGALNARYRRVRRIWLG